MSLHAGADFAIIRPTKKSQRGIHDHEESISLSVRFRTVGDISCTCPVASTAADVASIIEETVNSLQTERGATRMDDQTSDASMERRKKEGYF